MSYVPIPHLHQTEPGEVPAPVRVGVLPYYSLSFGDDLSGEGVVASQPTQLREHLVAVDVVVPRGRHWALKRAGIVLGACGGDTFDAAKLCKRVDAVRLKRLDELADRTLCRRASL